MFSVTRDSINSTTGGFLFWFLRSHPVFFSSLWTLGLGGKQSERLEEQQHRGFFSTFGNARMTCVPWFNWICCNSVKLRNLSSRDKGRVSSRHDVFFSTCSACPTYVPSAHGAYLLKARVLSFFPLSPSSGEKTCMQAVLWLFLSFSHEGLFFQCAVSVCSIAAALNFW